MKRLAIVTAAALATLLATLALWQAREVVLTLVVSIVLASTLDPAVRLLTRRGVGRELAVGIAFLSGLGLLLGVLVLLGTVLLGEVATALAQAPLLYEQGLAALRGQGGWLGDAVKDAPSIEELLAAVAPSGATTLLSGLLGFTSGLLAPLLFLVGAVTLGFYWMLEQQKVEWLWLSLLPLQARTQARTIWTRISAEVGIYVRGSLAIVVLTTLLLATVYNLLGLPFATLLALIGGLAQIVPWLGAAIGLLLAVLVALPAGPLSAGLTLVSVVLVLLVVKLVVEPWLFHDGVRVNPLLTVGALLALFQLGGLSAILAAPPLAAAVQVLYIGLIEAGRQERMAQPRAEVSALRERLEGVRQTGGYQLAQRPQLRGMVERAQRLIERADQALP